jgi:hypothetical protein
MTHKFAAFVALTLILLLGVGYLYYAYLIGERLPAGQYGPIRFPVGLGLILIALCLIEMVREYRRVPEPDEPRLTIPNAGKLAATIALTGAYFFLWSWLDQFYPTTFAFFLSLLLVYRGEYDLRTVSLMAGFAGAFTLLLYLVFQLAFGIRLT